MKIKQTIKNLLPRSLNILIRKIRTTMPYKPYMHKYKCVFVHIPKSAGTSIVDVLGGDTVSRSHLPAYIYKTADPERYDEYFKFTFVRNPWDRVVSTYEYWKQGLDQTDGYYQKILLDKYGTFEKFVLEFLDKDTICLHFMLRPQYLYLYDYREKLLVDFVGRFENINDDSNKIFKKLGINNTLKKINSSKRSNYQNYYINQEMIDKVAFLYKKDIELFDYKFDTNS